MPINSWIKRYQAQTSANPRLLRQPLRPGVWLVGGLGCQVLGFVSIGAYLATTARHLTPGRALSAFTIELAWRHEVHTGSGLGVLLLGASLFVSGSVMVARLFVRRRVTLLVAVPLAGAVGVLALGVLAFVVVTVVVVSWLAGTDGWDWANLIDSNWYSGGSRRYPRRRNER